MVKDNYLQQYIAKKVKYYRKKKRLSQEELSEKAGLGLKYINQIENQNINISIQTLNKVIAALDLTTEEFFNFNNLEEVPEPLSDVAFRRLKMKIKQLPKEKQASLIEIFEKILDQFD
ncbi:DNA-binding transcriptional regulator, XRE-family HTH domain [Streptococcus gallolyticus]|uniref:DNA-binding transcriptional regulator, XRE-family HTH domain n=1 Tax=Streptococcus gallolyticus TaxID=315405 RepID=A0A1I7I350_9STRE|nr:helix-turn-helix transcriptional regulator [Streptococcus gallolyticus]SFC62798.1 DNA-binding transcriptional regulator, XRE-family HTH domain [Streptococcus gallolyticus]SFU67355.1 DNA-binding transcriptional regulator, XRE-family HTH domain [Streptococcus gallolyticus]